MTSAWLSISTLPMICPVLVIGPIEAFARSGWCEKRRLASGS
jgi:hypothetical protein